MSSYRRDRNQSGSRSESESGDSRSESGRDAESEGSRSTLRLRSASVRVLRCLCAVLLDPLLNDGMGYREHGFRGVSETPEGFRAFDHLRLLNHRLPSIPPVALRVSWRILASTTLREVMPKI